jgi:hypothetical protein
MRDTMRPHPLTPRLDLARERVLGINGTMNRLKLSSFLNSLHVPWGMETEALRQRVQQEQRFVEWLRTANLRFADAQLERMLAIKSAHEGGLSIRQIEYDR